MDTGIRERTERYINDTNTIIDEVENSTTFLSCAVDALKLLHEMLEKELYLREQASRGMGYFLRICNAMAPVIRELDRASEDLDAVVTAAREQKKGA